MKKKKDQVLICEVLQRHREEENYQATQITEPEKRDDSSAVDEVAVKGDQELPIDLTGVATDAIDIVAINDEHGRISDMLEALEEATGMSVIPLKMGKIAPEVASLARHKIYEFDKERFAMSYKIRQKIVETFVERVMRSLSSGVPFREDLITYITYNGLDYRTFSLSEDEWLIVFSKFRHYKQRLFITEDKQFMIEILAERK